jgi:hypothetical protein
LWYFAGFQASVAMRQYEAIAAIGAYISRVHATQGATWLEWIRHAPVAVAAQSERFRTRHAAARHQDQHRPHDFAPVKQMQMMRFNGASWELFGPLMTGEVGG